MKNMKIGHSHQPQALQAALGGSPEAKRGPVAVDAGDFPRLETDLGALRVKKPFVLSPNAALLAPGLGQVPFKEAALLSQLLGIDFAAVPKAVPQLGGELAESLRSLLDTHKGGVDFVQGLLRERFLAKRAAVDIKPMKNISIGEVRFVEVGRLVPAQLRIAIPRVMDKLQMVMEKDGLAWSNEDHRYVPQFDGGRSALPEDKAKRAVAGPGGIVVVLDGNHQTCASILIEEAETTPVQFVGDYQDMAMDDFLKMAAKENWFYLAEFGGELKAGLASYADLKNDPYRFKMSSVMIRAMLEGDKLEFESEDRLQSRIWTSVLDPSTDKGSVDFVEFILADVLYRAQDEPDVRARFEALTGRDLKETLSLPEKPKYLAALAGAIHWTLQDAQARGDVDLDALAVFLNDPSTFTNEQERLAQITQKVLEQTRRAS